MTTWWGTISSAGGLDAKGCTALDDARRCERGGGGLPWQRPLLVVVFSDRMLEEGMGRLYGAYRAVDVVTVLTGPALHSV